MFSFPVAAGTDGNQSRGLKCTSLFSQRSRGQRSKQASQSYHGGVGRASSFLGLESKAFLRLSKAFPRLCPCLEAAHVPCLVALSLHPQSQPLFGPLILPSSPLLRF